jgi:predicted RNase H-like HicB family nuclease
LRYEESCFAIENRQDEKSRRANAVGLFSCAFEPEPDMGGYVATAPRVSGAVSWGKNLAEAKRMIAEAIEGVLEVDMLACAEKAGEVRFVRQCALHLVA